MRFLPLLFVALFTMSVAAPPKKVVIQTNAICEMCKSSIEKQLLGLDGVAKAELDLVTKKVKIKYDEDVIDVATLRQAIAATGYQADDVPPRPKAQANLAACCKPKDLETTKACSKSCAKPCEKEG